MTKEAGMLEDSGFFDDTPDMETVVDENTHEKNGMVYIRNPETGVFDAKPASLIQGIEPANWGQRRFLNQ